MIPSHPLPGDTFDVTTCTEGLIVRLRIVSDDDSDPEDYDCYDSAAMEQFAEGDRWFVGIVADVVFNEVTLKSEVCSLWGIEAGWKFDSSLLFAALAADLAQEAKPLDILNDFAASLPLSVE